ncbi:MAG: radical SAM protein [Oscillospiraceae bacterium]|nr:radical SAM protein [Oscillospiraceae bacterium]
MKNFDMETYLAEGTAAVVADIVRTSLFHPAEAKFMARYALAAKRAEQTRRRYAENGTHIPPYLIASITSRCNLHCAGCYARSLSTCEDGEPEAQLTAEEWERLFREAAELGVGFILLAGGEPLVRRDVIEAAARVPDILFPVFTNGTMLGGDCLDLFDANRNLVPVVSVEGGAAQTDARRGRGVYQRVADAMTAMANKHLAFAASVTLTKANLDEVLSQAFVTDLIVRGCKGVIYVEYVPTSAETEALAPGDAEREYFNARLAELRTVYDRTLFIAFPGDEKDSDGCLAAGRGFFHINSHGGAEPCPFSPYSDTNIKNGSLLDAMRSPLFTALRDSDMLIEEHKGGCVLFERRERVEALLMEG